MLTSKPQATRTWREDLGTRTLEISITGGRSYRSTSVRYRSSAKEQLTPRQRDVQALQESFYARLTPANRLILLIGELEADVNNGGFDQYLDNKGRRRARAALSALHTVGAHKTARMLEKAMAATTTPAQRSALDAGFHRGPEDLAVLAARHAGLDRPSA